MISWLKLKSQVLVPGCVLRAGPSEADQYEYFAIGEANDASQSPCSVIHVFARNIDEFHLRHFDDISDFMRNVRDSFMKHEKLESNYSSCFR